MRLINARTLQLEEFSNESHAKYAILSHRWEDDEVTYSDMQSLDLARTREGFYKIAKCCEEALRRECPYAWVDTCCIDKRSSSELSEAINSMFRWYQNSQICFAYLSDVGIDGPRILEQFKSSQWFQRGWTLQELLAPSQVFFYNSAWLRFGSKHRLVKELVEVTGIAEGALMGTRSVFDYSIAQRMHWASNRKTTRLEDRAYSLMGLFNVNMAMLYGEGEKAFMRLQEEIIKHSDDPTIFAWAGVKSNGSGLLASDLDFFADSSNVTVARPISPTEERQPWTMTNKGLFIELSLTPWTGGIYLAMLDCQPETAIEQNVGSSVGVLIQRMQGRQFRRIMTDFGDLLIQPKYQILWHNRIYQRLAIYVRQDELSSQTLYSGPVKTLPIYGVKLLPIDGIDMEVCVSTLGRWDPSSGIVELDPGQYGAVALIDLLPFSKSLGLVRIGLDFDFQPRIVMARNLPCSYRPYPKPDSTAIDTIWDVRFNHPTAWSAQCFAENPWPARDQFEGAIDDELVEDIFIYNVSDHHTSSLIYVMHRPRNGGPRVLVAELDLRPTTIKGRKVWSIGITVFPANGASPEDSAKVLDRMRQEKEAFNQTDDNEAQQLRVFEHVPRHSRSPVSWAWDALKVIRPNVNRPTT